MEASSWLLGDERLGGNKRPIERPKSSEIPEPKLTSEELAELDAQSPMGFDEGLGDSLARKRRQEADHLAQLESAARELAESSDDVRAQYEQ